MQFVVLDAETGDVVNEFGSGTTLSNTQLGNFTIQADPSSVQSGSVGSVVFEINGSSVTSNSAPFTLTDAAGEGFEPAELSPGSYILTATVYSGQNGTGNQLDTIEASFDVIGAVGSAETQSASGENLQEDQKSEFNVEGEAETEAETEAESEAESDISGGAVASSAVAAAFGANAVTQTLASGSVSLDIQNANEAIGAEPTQSEGPSGSGGRPVGGDEPLAGGDQPPAVAIVSGEAEAEAEVEAEAETEAEIGSASATAGISAAVAAVGTDAYLQADGSPALVSTRTVTSIDGASSTQTSVSDFNGAVDPTLVSADPADEGTPDEAVGTPAGETNDGPTTSELDGDAADTAIARSDSETEIEIEAEAEAEIEVEAGTAAAAAAGGSGVAVVGNFGEADTETSIGTAASTSAVTEFTPELFNLGVNSPGTLTSASAIAPTANATKIVFTNGAQSSGGTLQAAPTTPAGDTTSDVIPSTGFNEAEAEAEAEVEIEVGVSNGAAAVAAVATGGAGSTGIGATSLVSASTAGIALTAQDVQTLTRANDVVESTTFRSPDDADLTDTLARSRSLNDGIAAEAEAEVDAEAEVEIESGTPTISITSDGNGLGSAVSASGVAVGGILTSRTGEVSTGVSTIAERETPEDEAPRPREAVGAEDGTAIGFPTGNFEVEAEAEAEAEAEVEVGFNSVAVGAGAVAVEARNAFIGLSADATTATSTSASLQGGEEYTFDDIDRPGPEPLGDTGQIVLPAVDLSGLVFEVEVEAEAEAEVGYNAGAAAGAAGAAGFEGISAVIEMDATTNAAASAAASGAYTDVQITVPEEGMAGFVTATARAWDPDGRGVAVAVAVAGLPQIGGADNEAEVEAEGLFEAVVEVSIYTEAYDPANISYLFDTGAAIADADGEPSGPDSTLESEAEVEAEAEAEAGYGVAGAAAATAVSGFAGIAVASTATATGETASIAADVFGGTFDGTSADDTLTGTAQVDLLRGLSGNDILSGGASGDRLEGGLGIDILNGDAGDDALFGGGGSDRLVGGAGRDRIEGGAGADTAVFEFASTDAEVFADLNGVVFVREIATGDVDQLIDVEQLEFTDGQFASSDVGTFNGLSLIASDENLQQRFEQRGLDANTLINIAALAYASAPIGTYAAPTFSAENYLEANPDLALRFGDDLVGAALEFINSGAAAGRDPGEPTEPMITEGVVPTPGDGEPDNAPPEVVTVVEDQTATAGQAFTFEIPENAFVDPDSELSLTAAGLPSGLSFSDGAIQGTPAQTGTFEVTLTASDGQSSVQQSFDLVIEAQSGTGDPVSGIPTIADFASVLEGTDGRDRLIGTDEADWINGLGDNDFIRAGAGDDYIIAGGGNDYNVMGGLGADLFEFGSGSGTLKILDFEVGVDKIVLTGNLEFSDLNVSSRMANGVSATNLRTDEGERLILSGVSLDELDASDFVKATGGVAPPETGGGNGETTAPMDTDFDNIITGTSGRDRLTGTDQADFITALGDNDIIRAGAGDDYIDAGAGGDFNVSGGSGSDVFVFGFGSDTVKVLDFEQGVDSILLTDDLSFDDLTVKSFTDASGTTTSRLETADGDRFILVDTTPDQIDTGDFFA